MTKKLKLDTLVYDLNGDVEKADVRFKMISIHYPDGTFKGQVAEIDETTGEPKILSSKDLTMRIVIARAFNNVDKEMNFAEKQRFGRISMSISVRKEPYLFIRETDVRERLKTFVGKTWAPHVCAQFEAWIEGTEYTDSKDVDIVNDQESTEQKSGEAGAAE